MTPTHIDPANLPDFSDRRVIFVASYPRSGGTWLCRSLAHALGCPSLSWIDTAPTIITDPVVEGLDRKRVKYIVRRGHLSLSYHRNYHKPDRFAAIVAAVRDPRDVAVSCWHHYKAYPRGIDGLAQCVRQLCGVEHKPPLQPMFWGGAGRPGWSGFVEKWLDEGVPLVRFEDHLEAPEETLQKLIGELWFKTPAKRIAAAVEANRFENREPDYVMRRGIAGEWREVMPEEVAAMVVEYCGDVMERLGYV